VRPMGRATAGVAAIRLLGNDTVVSMDVVNPDTKASLLILTTKGIGKRTPISHYPKQGRAGSGVRNITLVGKSGEVCVARVVYGNDDMVVISTQGQVIRVFADLIPFKGRPAQGVNVMSMRDKDEVASIALIPRTNESGKILGDAELEVLTEEAVLDDLESGEEVVAVSPKSKVQSPMFKDQSSKKPVKLAAKSSNGTKPTPAKSRNGKKP